METTSFSEMSVRSYGATLHYVKECSRQSHCCENLKGNRVTMRGSQFCPAYILVVNNGYAFGHSKQLRREEGAMELGKERLTASVLLGCVECGHCSCN
jgi:hypothetical protein